MDDGRRVVAPAIARKARLGRRRQRRARLPTVGVGVGVVVVR